MALASTTAPLSPTAASKGRTRVVDAVLAAALLCASVLARRHVLPHDGLWGDDAWVAFGAKHGSPGGLLTAGFAHPGFTAVLMVWSRVLRAPEDMAVVPFAIGVVSPTVLYVALRRFGHAVSISLLLAVSLLAARFHVEYSGRVKTYVIDAVVVLVFAVVVPRLARRRWDWRVAAGYVAVTVVVGVLTPFGLIAGAAATVLLLLRPAGDLPWRAGAAVAQATVYGMLSLAVRERYGVQKLHDWWEDTFDGFIGSRGHVLHVPGDTVRHLYRSVVPFAGRGGALAVLLLGIAIAGLVADAAVRRHTSRALRAQYLLVLLLAAVAAGILGLLPFGPTAAGMRLSIWLLPLYAIGTAAALRYGRSWLARYDYARAAFDAGAIVLAIVIAGSAVGDGGSRYPLNGVRTATNYIEAHLGADGVVLVDHDRGQYPFGVQTSLAVALAPTPHGKVAFEPRFRDTRVHTVAYTTGGSTTVILSGTRDIEHHHTLPSVLRRARHVYVLTPGWTAVPQGDRFALGVTLRLAGYRPRGLHRFDETEVAEWARP
jgi:hypothetical protein